jgi:HEAT repeat protein
MSEVDRIAKLLKDEAVEKQIAAAIVLGELRAKGPKVVEGLAAALDSGIPLLQRHALEALEKVGAKRALSKILPLLGAREDDVRRAAVRAVSSIGKEVLPTIRARMATATPDERRALDAILAELGGKDAFHTLLGSLSASDAEAAKAAALAVRQQVKSADGRQRKAYLTEVEKFLKAQKKGLANQGAVAAAIKILGYLEEPKAIPTLLSYAQAKDAAPMVRQEAIIALRFALGDWRSTADAVRRDAHHAARASSKVYEALISAAESDDRTLAQTALVTLGSLELPAELSKRLEKLASHPDLDRARFVLEHLGRQPGPEAARILVHALTKLDRNRAQIAAQAIGSREEAVPYLAKALLETTDPDRAWVLRNVLRPTAKKISSAMRKQLLAVAVDRLGKGERGWEALLDVVRDADPESVAEALRALAQKLRKSGKDDKALSVYSVLCKSDRATDDDRFAMAALELGRSVRDTRPASRAGDESLRHLGVLLSRGYDVAKALRKDRGIDLEHLYYVGFHFAEEGHPVGEELLGEVVKKGGRNKLARMAKNKLALAEQA